MELFGSLQPPPSSAGRPAGAGAALLGARVDRSIEGATPGVRPCPSVLSLFVTNRSFSLVFSRRRRRR